MTFLNQLAYLTATIQSLPDLPRHRVKEGFVAFAGRIANHDRVFEGFLDFEDTVDQNTTDRDLRDKIKSHAVKLLETTITNMELEGLK